MYAPTVPADTEVIKHANPVGMWALLRLADLRTLEAGKMPLKK